MVIGALLAVWGHFDPRSRATGEVAAGDGEEHVVEVRGVDRHPLDGDTFRCSSSSNSRSESTEPSPGTCRTSWSSSGAAAGSSSAAAQRCRSGEVEPDVAARDAALQFVRCAFGDDPSLVEHRDPVGQLVCLVEVLGGEQDRDARRRRARG